MQCACHFLEDELENNITFIVKFYSPHPSCNVDDERKTYLKFSLCDSHGFIYRYSVSQACRPQPEKA